jgi:hypothetical protein
MVAVVVRKRAGGGDRTASSDALVGEQRSRSTLHELVHMRHQEVACGVRNATRVAQTVRERRS